MKSMLGKICLFILALTASVGVGVSVETRVESGQEPNFSDLTLELKTKEKGFLALEPIPLVITLSNKTEQPILGHTAIKFSQSHIELLIGPRGGELRKVQKLSALLEQVSVKGREIRPGEAHEAIEVLTSDLDKLFPETGKYQIQAVLYDRERKTELKSNVISVHLVEPAGRDRDALEFIRGKRNAADYFSGMGLASSRRAQDDLEDLASNFADSPYADYANYLLGELFFFKEEYVKANEKFSKLAGKSDFAHAKKVKEYLREIKDKLPSAQGS